MSVWKDRVTNDQKKSKENKSLGQMDGMGISTTNVFCEENPLCIGGGTNEQ